MIAQSVALSGLHKLLKYAMQIMEVSRSESKITGADQQDADFLLCHNKETIDAISIVRQIQAKYMATKRSTQKKGV